MHNNQPFFQISQASLKYEKKIIFGSLKLDIFYSRWLALLGPSGIGKSSLLRLIAGLIQSNDHIDAKITIAHENFHHSIAYMAQTDLLLPWLTTLDNAILGSKLRNLPKSIYQEKKEQALTLLKQVGLEKAIYQHPHQLSGGMRQRVALVRTLMENKPIILMDEPFSALDAITKYKLQELAVQLLKDKTILFITHDPLEALRLANDIYIMQGQPAVLKSIAHLISPTPRELNTQEVLDLQKLLFTELSKSII